LNWQIQQRAGSRSSSTHLAALRRYHVADVPQPRDLRVRRRLRTALVPCVATAARARLGARARVVGVAAAGRRPVSIGAALRLQHDGLLLGLLRLLRLGGGLGRHLGLGCLLGGLGALLKLLRLGLARGLLCGLPRRGILGLLLPQLLRHSLLLPPQLLRNGIVLPLLGRRRRRRRCARILLLLRHRSEPAGLLARALSARPSAPHRCSISRGAVRGGGTT